jgi:hypothetical protein
LRREIRKELFRLSPAAGVDLRKFWNSFRKLEAFYDCEPYILLDQRVPLSLLVHEALGQSGSS